MRYKPQPITIKFKTITPVFIGSGEEIKPLSFVATGSTVYVLDGDRLFHSLSSREREYYLNWIDPIIEQMGRLEGQIQQAKQTHDRSQQRRLTPQLRQLEGQLSVEEFVQRRMRAVNAKQFVEQRKCVAYQLQTTTRLGARGFRAGLKDAQHQPYLPGTELKGALRTALLFDLLEAPKNYQILKQAMQQFKPIVAQRKPNREQIGKEISKIVATVEEELLRGHKNDAKFDLLRLFRVGDSEPLGIDNLLLELSKSVGTNRTTDTILETVCNGTSGQFRLEIVADQAELLNQLGLGHHSEWVSMARLMEACYKRSTAILQAEQAYFEQNDHRALAQRLSELSRLNTPRTPLLRLGGGQGLLSITTDLWLRERDPDLYEILRQGVSAQRKWNTVKDNFPKTRRVIWRKGQPVDLLGWIQLIPPLEAQNLVSADLKFQFSPIAPSSQTTSRPLPKAIPTSPPQAATERTTGRVKWFDASKGYGFIKPDGGGKDIFAHISQVDGPPLQDGERVSFKIGQGRRGLEAHDVKREEV